MQAWLEQGLMTMADRWTATRTYARPRFEQLAVTRVVSHRGEHDNHRIFENTFAAFDQALAAGVWGLELDLRWTADGEPVVLHDADCRRLWGWPRAVAELNLCHLQANLPGIPSLAAFVERYAGRAHLMIELKPAGQTRPARIAQVLQCLLSRLTPVKDYHFLSLQPALFKWLTEWDPAVCLPVAGFNLPYLSRLARRHEWGGVTGHYLLMSERRLRQHQLLGQAVGTGFIASEANLYREINRGVDWIFTNRARHIQNICREYSA